jgi:1-deoxy-D-xylulose-5-phosphate reductoisomerase
LLKERSYISILGSTGSIGRNALEVVSHLRDRFSVRYLSANTNTDLIAHQVREFRPRSVAMLDKDSAYRLSRILDSQTEVLAGTEGLLELAGRDDSDLVVNALVGSAGLRPTMAALEAGKNVALANKETLVIAGHLVTELARKKGVNVLPVDSEHSAILQCLQGEQLNEVSRLIITASGGPFLHLRKADLPAVTVQEAMKHPTWTMGKKITIDSATLMNKGLEVIEACMLFGLPPSKISVLIHPQSIVHSMVEFADGSVKAQLGMPDMRLPIQYALTYPERPAAAYRKIDFTELANLTFLQPDTDKFPCLSLAFRALEMGGTAPTVLNAANEVAVQLFLDGRIPFTAIHEIISTALLQHTPMKQWTVEDILACDIATRETLSLKFGRTETDRKNISIRQTATG